MKDCKDEKREDGIGNLIIRELLIVCVISNDSLRESKKGEREKGLVRAPVLWDSQR